MGIVRRRPRMKTMTLCGLVLYLRGNRPVTEDELISLAFGGRATCDRFEVTLYVQPGRLLYDCTVLVTPAGKITGSSSPGARPFLYASSSPVQVSLVPQ